MEKDELKEIPFLNKLINSNLRQLEELKLYRDRLPGLQDGDPVQTSGISDRTGNLAVKIASLDNRINEEIDILVDKKEEARELFENLNNNLKLKMIMELRYLECMEWEEVSKVSYYSLRYVHKLHGQAMETLFEKDTKRHVDM